MDRKSKNTLIISIIALALVLIGVTYAYFSARITGLESASTISLTAGRMGIHYTEGNEEVNIQNIYPREEAWATKTFTLTGYNTTDTNMDYSIGLNVITNTFPDDYLSYNLRVLESTNGTPVGGKTDIPIAGTGYIKFGRGVFTQANGDVHRYELKIFFKDNGYDQNDAQQAVFNAKITVSEYISNVAKGNQNHNGKHCFTNDYVQGVDPEVGDEYINGQYTYTYKMAILSSDYMIGEIDEAGWSVVLNDSEAGVIDTELCAYVNDKPIVNMNLMFANTNATTIDLSSFDTSNVTSMRYMFSWCPVTSLDLSTFDTFKVTDMSNMFANSSATSLDLSSFDTYNVTDMQSMFYYSHATSVNTSSFDTSNVENMYSMFHLCSAEELDLSNFDTSNVTNMAYMFADSRATVIDTSSFNTRNVIDMNDMFENSNALTLNLLNFDVSNVENFNSMFANTKATSLDLSNFHTDSAVYFNDMFYKSAALSLDLSAFNTSNAVYMAHMFREAAATSINVLSFDTRNVATMELMFYKTNVSTLDLSSFDTSSVTNMTNMFYQTTATTGYAGTQADVSRFNSTPGSLANGGNPNTNKPNLLTFTVK